MDYIKILIVDDDPAWVKILTEILNTEPDFIVAGSALNKESALELIRANEADLVLLDLNLDGDQQAGIEITREAQKYKPIKFMVVTAYSVEDLILESFAAGAKHFFSKDDLVDIPHAIRLSYRNASPLDILLKSYIRMQHELMLAALSPAERELLPYIMEGMTIKEMAQVECTSEAAIKQKVGRILKKLKVKRRSELPRDLL